MMSKHVLAGCALAAMVSGCATVQSKPLQQDAVERFSGRTLLVTRHPAPVFTAMTAGKATFGLIGAGMMGAAGQKIVNENGIPDPAIAIREAVASTLAEKWNMTVVPTGDATSPSDVVPQVLSDFPPADYLLAVKTKGWMFTYYPTNWSHYRVVYDARLRLIDSSAKKVVVEDTCKVFPVDDQNPPTREQLLENGAALLKQYLDKAAAECAQVLLSPLGLSPTGQPSQGPAEVVEAAEPESRTQPPPAPEQTPEGDPGLPKAWREKPGGPPHP